MEWSNAKKFVIVLLVLLNVLLAGLNYKQNRENTMTATQERSIFEVLSRNGITMYTDLLTEHPPMSRLAVELPSYNKETLERLFFGSARTTVSTKGGETVYQGKQSSLTMSGARGVWETKAVKSGKGEMTKTEALREAQKFIDNTEHFFGSYGDSIIAEESEGFRVNFFGQYKREKVFANYFSFFVTADGIQKITFNYYPVRGYTGEKQDLSYADEALLAFMREWKKGEHAEEATIDRMELGYARMESNTAADGVASINLEPCYRIYLMDEEKPYLINAYTCQILNQ